MNSREHLVGLFNEGAGFVRYSPFDNTEQQWENFYEEVDELSEAAQAYEDAMERGDVHEVSDARLNLVKEWADAQVTLSNLAWLYGINGDEAFHRVNESNMTKIGGPVIKRSDTGKILKPDNYVKPDMSGL